MEILSNQPIKKKLVLIGASTGGPSHLKAILEDIKVDENSLIVVAQHMNQAFLPSFAMQFDKDCKSSVKLISEDGFLETKNIYICKFNTKLSKGYSKIQASICNNIYPFSPNVNLLFSSAVNLKNEYNIFAVLMTGIGDDGAKGLSELAVSGAQVLAQDEKSCVVYGMPKRAKELIPNLCMQNLAEIKKSLETFLK